jgi:hypothetical protein
VLICVYLEDGVCIEIDARVVTEEQFSILVIGEMVVMNNVHDGK